MLKIIFKDKRTKIYKKSEYTNYWYDRKIFVVIRKKWIEIYNIDCIASVECKD
jgi:hypothetical protein